MSGLRGVLGPFKIFRSQSPLCLDRKAVPVDRQELAHQSVPLWVPGCSSRRGGSRVGAPSVKGGGVVLLAATESPLLPTPLRHSVPFPVNHPVSV